MKINLNSVHVTDADIVEYRERGYWISPKLLGDEDIARLRHEFERVYSGDFDFECWPFHGPQEWDAGSPRVRTFANGWWVNAGVRDVVTSPVLGAVGARLMETPEVRLWHDQVIYKPGAADPGDAAPSGTAGNIGWHQDYGYWQTCSTHNMCTAWIALQDTDLNNGGMRTIVGSHHGGLAENSGNFFEPDLDKLHGTLAAGRDWRDEPCIMRAGQASFHHALCFHGSGPNRSATPRLSIAVHLMPADCAYRKCEQYHPNLRALGPLAREGQLFAGDWFPRLWPVGS